MMNKFLVVLFAALVVMPAAAVAGNDNFGLSYGFGERGTFGVTGELDVSSKLNNQPVSIQVLWKSYSQRVSAAPEVFYNYYGLGAAAIYDFSTIIKLHKKVKPYAGAGLLILNSKTNLVSGSVPPPPDSSGLHVYYTAGIRYALSQDLQADFSFNNYGLITIGMNFGL